MSGRERSREKERDAQMIKRGEETDKDNTQISVCKLHAYGFSHFNVF